MESGGGKMKFIDLCKILQQVKINGDLVVREQCGCCYHEEEVYRETFIRDELGTTDERLKKFVNRKVVAIVGEPDNSFGGIIIVVKDKDEL